MNGRWLVRCGLGLALAVWLVACDNGDDGTDEPPGGPINTLTITNGVAHADNGNSSGSVGALAAPAPAAGQAYELVLPNGDRLAPPTQVGDGFSCGVEVDGTVVLQATAGQILIMRGEEKERVPQGTQWTLKAGSAEVLQQAIVGELQLQEFVPEGGVDQVPPVPTAVPLDDLVVVTVEPTEPVPEPTIGPPTQAPTEKPTDAPTPTEEPVVLDVWHGWTGSLAGALEGGVQAFVDRYPQADVRLVAVPASELEARYVVSVEGGVPPAMVLAWNDMAIAWASGGYVQPVDPVLEEGSLGGLHPAALDGMRYQGSLWGVPVLADTYGLYYNREWLEALGLEPPQTTDELLKAVQSGDSTLVLPRNFPFAYGLFEGFGGALVQDGEQVVVDRDETLAFLEYAAALHGSGNVYYLPLAEGRAVFAESGEAAMIIDSVGMLEIYRGQLGQALGVVGLPYVSETEQPSAPLMFVNGCLLPANVGGDERKLALELALFLTGETFQASLAENGYLPANAQVAVEDPLLGVFAQQARFASPGPIHPNRSGFWEPCDRMLEGVLFDGMAFDEAAKLAADGIYQEIQQ